MHLSKLARRRREKTIPNWHGAEEKKRFRRVHHQSENGKLDVICMA